MNIYDYVQRKVAEKPHDGSIGLKYLPKTLGDLTRTCHDMAILCANQWFRTFRDKGREQARFLMISGPSGVGKTTLARLAAKENGFDVAEVPCSLVKSKKDLELSLRSVTNKHACIVDEVDEIETQVLSDVKDFAKEHPGIPLVFVCTKHAYGKPVDLVKHSELVQLRRAPRPKLVEWLQAIIQQEGLDVDPAFLIDQSKGDLKQILCMLDLNRKPTGQILVSKKDPAVDAINAVEMLMCSSQPLPMPVAMRLVTLDPNIVTTMVSENYLDVAQDLEGIARAADAFSAADMVDTKIYASQCWELWDTWTYFGAVYPAFQVRRQSTHDIRFTKLWSKMSNMYLRRGYMADLKKTTSQAMDIDTVYAISRCMGSVLLNQGAPDMVLRYGHMVPYDLVAFVMRLSMKSDLKQAMINRIKAAYKARAAA